MKLLHIDASILGGNSVSRQLSAAAVERLRKTTPNLDVTYRDISATPLSHLTGEHLAAAHGATPETAAVRDDIAASVTALDEFLAADIVVIGAPMYNFTIPSQLKAWIDRILVAGKTFKYSDKGVEGLAGNKRVIVAISRGGFYGADTSAAAGEHLETYLRWVFGFIGINNPEIIAADGIQIGPEQREKAVAGALRAADALQAVPGQQAA
jgi:FMN-dependent NADH-azoreductase